MIISHMGKRPKIHKTSFVAENAQIIGNVELGEHSSVWFGAVLRGDVNKIRIGKNSNIQDNSVLHGTETNSTSVNEGVSVGHGAIVHGCRIKSNCIIGMGSVILSGAVVGENCIIAAGAVVKENENIPPGSLVAGVPAKIMRKLTEKDIEKIKNNALEYLRLKREYRNL